MLSMTSMTTWQLLMIPLPFSTDSNEVIIDYARRIHMAGHLVTHVELNRWHEDDFDTASVFWGHYGRPDIVYRYKKEQPKVDSS
jgi:hypothetical protein